MSICVGEISSSCSCFCCSCCCSFFFPPPLFTSSTSAPHPRPPPPPTHPLGSPSYRFCVGLVGCTSVVRLALLQAKSIDCCSKLHRSGPGLAPRDLRRATGADCPHFSRPAVREPCHFSPAERLTWLHVRFPGSRCRDGAGIVQSVVGWARCSA